MQSRAAESCFRGRKTTKILSDSGSIIDRVTTMKPCRLIQQRSLYPVVTLPGVVVALHLVEEGERDEAED